jgi:WD40 repeat protein
LAPGGRPVKLLNLANLHTAPPSSLRWSPLPQQCHEVITTAEDGTCKVSDVAQRAIIATLATPAAPFAAAPVDASTLAVGYGRRVGLWDRRAAPSLVNQQGQGQPQAGGLITDVAAVVGAPLLFSASVDGTVKAWDLRRGLDGGSGVATLRFRPEDVVSGFISGMCL